MVSKMSCKEEVYDIAFDGGIIIKAKNKEEALQKLKLLLDSNNIHLHDHTIEVNE